MCMRDKMKVTMLLLILIFSQPVNGGQICEAYITNEWYDTRYIVESISNDNIVIDNKTGLIWKQCSEGLSGSDCSSSSLIAYTWQDALDLASLTDFAGFTDWRVPNIEELRSITAINCFSPTINSNIFPNTQATGFWSSSPFLNNQSEAWYINFKFGNNAISTRLSTYNLRLVRSGN